MKKKRKSKDYDDMILFECPKCKRQQYALPFATVICSKCHCKFIKLGKKG